MNLADALLRRLKTEQAQFALEGLQKPAQRDAFEYGFRSGVVTGYDKAIQALLSLLDDDEKHGDQL